MLEENETINQI